MVINKTLMALIVYISLCMANISGIVTDTNSLPISGAVVQLEKGGQTAITGTDGSFTLDLSSAVLPGNKKVLPDVQSAIISGQLLKMTISKRAVVEITTFNLNGKLLSTMHKSMDAGNHAITLPYHGAGVYLYKVKIGNNALMIKGNTVDGISTGSTVTISGVSSNTFAKKAIGKKVINDILWVKKNGYLNHRIFVKNSDTSGIILKMVASYGTLTDVDGNVYQTVKIGDREWMAENLRVTRYNDGTPIPMDSTKTFVAATTPKYCYYKNATDKDSIIKYGALYNWFVVRPGNSLKIAPPGWHVPSDSEWTDLSNSQSIYSLVLSVDWCESINLNLACPNMTNSSGFSALPAGYRAYQGTYEGLGYTGSWWSATGSGTYNAYIRYLTTSQAILIKNTSDKSCGLSIRLVRD